MTSHIQFFKDQMKLFDQTLQEKRQQIRDLQADIAEIEQARLTTARMMEQVFGEPEQTVVMQDMSMKQGSLPRAATVQQIAAPQRGVINDDPTLPPLGTPERKRELDRRKYHRRKAQGYQKPTGKRGGSLPGQPRNTPENRAQSASARQRVRNALEHRTEPVSSGDLIRLWNVTEPDEKQRIYNAITALHTKGELRQVGVNGHGFTYLLADVADKVGSVPSD